VQTLRSLLIDLALCTGFFTRLPVPHHEAPRERFAACFWAVPLAGVAVALIGAAAFALAHLAGLGSNSAALIGVGATMLATGCFHEDGLSDVSDGFGGGTSVERKLEIMHDSRLGTYGTAAFLVSVGLRWSALAALPGPAAVLAALVAAHAASRGVLPAFLRVVPVARRAGLSASVGIMPGATVLWALLLGGAGLLALGPLGAVLGAALCALAFAAMRALTLRQIGGQTGDVCGALQQVCETALLLLASVLLA
jgi:adenosylcobinamide-GDP ribazoletransferase